MNQGQPGIRLANWQITATTIPCDLVEDDITIIVSKDWTYRCVWYQRYKQKTDEGGKAKFDRKMRDKVQKCAGPDCPNVTGYRDKLIREENNPG